MAYVQNFAATQVLGEPSVIYLEDTTTGTLDPLITARRVVITNAANEFITADGVSETATYTEWALVDSETSIDCLTSDMALYVRVNWVNSVGATLATKITLYGFYSYTQDFLLQLTKNQTADITILADTNYWADKTKLHTLLKDAINAVEIGGDIFSAQNSLNMAEYLIQNSANFF